MTESAAPAPAAAPQGEDDDRQLRPAHGWPGKLAFWAGVVISVLHLWFNTVGTLSELRVAVIHFAGFGLLCALLYPAWHARGAAGARAALALDVVLALLALSLVAYLVLGEESFYARTMVFRWYDWVFTSIAVALAVEFTRRTTGWIIPILIVVAFTYVTLWGRYVGGMLTFPGLSAEIMLFRTFYSDDGMFGTIAAISASFVFMFILFGAFLLRSGTGDFIIDFARAVASRMVGGPGVVAVVGSALMGTISGSAVANTVSTGSITIPLMKRSGYPAKFAGGVEAAASTGGQLMPPIMGAGAFVMASFTQIPYLTIAAVSILPALLYFVSVMFYVRITAKRLGLQPVDEQTKTVGQVLREGGFVFFVPVTVLIGLLVYGYTPTYAAGISIVAVIVASWFSRRPEHRMGPRAILEALALGARNMTMTAVLLCGIGLVVNAVTLTGVGNTFSLMIGDWSGNSVFVAMVLIALASLVLGMGLPVTAAYIVLATLSAPALADLITGNQLVQALMEGRVPTEAAAVFMLVAPESASLIGQPIGRELAEAMAAAVPLDMKRMVTEQVLSGAAITAALLSAHMIIFWLSQDSNITPPVCLTAFAAAAIARSKPMATGLVSWRLAKGLYIVPFLFAYTGLLGGSWEEKLQVTLFATVALYCFAAAFEGTMEARIGWPMRLLLFALFLALIWPAQTLLHWGGLALFVVVFVHNVWTDRRAIRAAAAASR